FILTSIMWASGLAMAVDRRMLAASAFYTGAAVCTLFGLMHSPLPNAPVLAPVGLGILPDHAVLPADHLPTVLNWTGGYLLVAAMMIAWHFYLAHSDQLDTAESPQ
ncbi:MAG: hypothetical protein D6753_02535, partial [Planctomycetota bacterium]